MGVTGSFGHSVDIYGNLAAVGVPTDKKAYIYRQDSLGVWNIGNSSNFLPRSGLSGSSQYGEFVAIDNNLIVVGDPGDNKIFIYRYRWTGASYVWQQEPGSPIFITGGTISSIDIADEIIAIGKSDSTVNSNPNAGEVDIYRYAVSSTSWYKEQTVDRMPGVGGRRVVILVPMTILAIV